MVSTQDRRVNNGFSVGMKLEAVDLREPALVCPATITDTRGSLLRIHFDGWDDSYDQLVDMDTLDVFPVMYCIMNGHPLQPPGSVEILVVFVFACFASSQLNNSSNNSKIKAKITYVLRLLILYKS